VPCHHQGRLFADRRCLSLLCWSDADTSTRSTSWITDASTVKPRSVRVWTTGRLLPSADGDHHSH